MSIPTTGRGSSISYNLHETKKILQDPALDTRYGWNDEGRRVGALIFVLVGSRRAVLSSKSAVVSTCNALDGPLNDQWNNPPIVPVCLHCLGDICKSE